MQSTDKEEAKSQLNGLSDWFIKDFTLGQKEYIVQNLYPVLQKTLVHFVAEAKRFNQIKEKTDSAKVNERLVKGQPPKSSSALYEQKKTDLGKTLPKTFAAVVKAKEQEKLKAKKAATSNLSNSNQRLNAVNQNIFIQRVTKPILGVSQSSAFSTLRSELMSPSMSQTKLGSFNAKTDYQGSKLKSTQGSKVLRKTSQSPSVSYLPRKTFSSFQADKKSPKKKV